jgi:hypothetical protein
MAVLRLLLLRIQAQRDQVSQQSAAHIGIIAPKASSVKGGFSEGDLHSLAWQLGVVGPRKRNSESTHHTVSFTVSSESTGSLHYHDVDMRTRR